MELDKEKLPWQKENKSQCLGNGSLPEAIYSVANPYVVSKIWYLNTRSFKNVNKEPHKIIRNVLSLGFNYYNDFISGRSVFPF